MIKDNEIDLTEHRDFRGEFNSPRLIRRNGELYSDLGDFVNKAVHRDLYGNIPWSVTPLYQYYEFDGVFPLGNKEQRKRIMATRYWGTRYNIVCDCCGKEYRKIPWRRDWGLCNECNRETKTRDNRPFSLDWIRIGE